MKTRNSLAFFILSLLALFAAGCSSHSNNFDATGTFEAEETLISAEATGTLKLFTIEEGDKISAGSVVGVIDTTQLYLRKKQLSASVQALLSKRPDKETQLATIQKQIDVATTEKQRFENLVKSNAAAQKQLDDILNNIAVLQKQYKATEKSLNISIEGLNSETLPLLAQIEQTQDQINKSIVKNPLNGTVLVKYARPNEMTTTGKALYKVANLDTLTLRAYISNNQLAVVKLGQTVKVFTDNGKGGFNEQSGTITWISSKSEFTPKTIQTQEERANLVYAVKIRVPNSGLLKIGMYGEIRFDGK